MITETFQGAVRVLAPSVALTGEAAESLVADALRRHSGGRPQLVIDLTDVPLLDSQGCESLLDVQEAYAGVGGEVCLAAPSRLSADILAVTGLDAVCPVFEDVNKAVASFAR